MGVSTDIGGGGGGGFTPPGGKIDVEIDPDLIQPSIKNKPSPESSDDLDIEIEDDPEHRKTDGDSYAYRESDEHRAAADGSVGDILYLLVQHVDGRLSLHDEPAHQHTDGNDDPVIGQGRQLPAQIGARRQEAHVNARQEQNQTNVCKENTQADLEKGVRLHSPNKELENKEDRNDGQ